MGGNESPTGVPMMGEATLSMGTISSWEAMLRPSALPLRVGDETDGMSERRSTCAMVCRSVLFHRLTGESMEAGCDCTAGCDCWPAVYAM